MNARPIQLTNRLRFPDPRAAVRGGVYDGLVAIGGDLSAERLLLAYRSGIFPWTDDPITWWSPDPRGIFELDRVHISESLARVIRKGVFQVTIDRAFRQVMEGCAAPAPGWSRTPTASWRRAGRMQACIIRATINPKMRTETAL